MQLSNEQLPSITGIVLVLTLPPQPCSLLLYLYTGLLQVEKREKLRPVRLITGTAGPVWLHFTLLTVSRPDWAGVSTNCTERGRNAAAGAACTAHGMPGGRAS